MKEILIVSGKGGTGKTSITACFAQLSGNSVFCDCDVDASNLHLLLSPEIKEQHDFRAGWVPVLNTEKCVACGTCNKLCRFNAISMTGGRPRWQDGLCEGCGVCADHCPANAIELQPADCGRWYRSDTEYGTLFHAELFPGQENSGKLIAELKKAAREEAARISADRLISDGPPGIGCPVISSMSGVDMAVAVTEPTPSGLHDLKRLALLARQFETPLFVIVNKWDLNSELSDEISAFCRDSGIRELGHIPYDPLFTKHLKEGRTVLSSPDSAPAKEIVKIWNKIMSAIC